MPWLCQWYFHTLYNKVKKDYCKEDDVMKPGKVSEAILKRSVLKQISNKSEILINGAAVGNDAALFVISKDNNNAASSIETVIDDYELQKARAVIRAANNVWAKGAVPKTAQLAITLPTKALESDLRALAKEYIDACKQLNIQVTGGHTEVSEYVSVPIVTATVYGEASDIYSLKNITEGEDIVMTKAIGLEGSYLLAKKQYEFFSTRFSKSYIDKSLEYIKQISISKEAAVAVKHGVTAMHDLSENGILGALWEIGEAGNCGVSVDIKAINVHQETIELCEYFDINPYKIPSSGALLMITSDGEELVNALEEAGVEAAVIGKVTSGHDKVIINEDETRYLEPPKVQKSF